MKTGPYRQVRRTTNCQLLELNSQNTHLLCRLYGICGSHCYINCIFIIYNIEFKLARYILLGKAIEYLCFKFKCACASLLQCTDFCLNTLPIYTLKSLIKETCLQMGSFAYVLMCMCKLLSHNQIYFIFSQEVKFKFWF